MFFSPIPPNAGRGFTLIECAMTTVITGLAFVAIMQLFAAHSRIASAQT